MATAFRRKRGRIVGTLDQDELGIVVHLLKLTRDFVAPERAETGDPFLDLVAGMGETDPDPSEPSDPALLRLLPPAHRTDSEQAGEFRRLTEHSLRTRKAANAKRAIEVLEGAPSSKLELDDGQAQAIMVALTDIRLILGERLDLRTDEDSERLRAQLEASLSGEAEMDPAKAQQMAYYDFLSWLQESLTMALMQR
ncbi:DUF2017 domain-containing protein [Ornithinimicrobium sp. Arc0846-15]|nr:DUF2017 domain-containing protein [Ornithinimicrobium laminariae]